MAAGTPPTERSTELRRSYSSDSDAFDLRTALESRIRRMLETAFTRSVVGSADVQVDTESWADEFVELVRKFPAGTPPTGQGNTTPTLIAEKPRQEEETHKNVPAARKKSGNADVAAMRGRCKKLQEVIKDEKAARADLQKAKDVVDAEHERLMAEEKELKDEMAKAATKANESKTQLEELRKRFNAEKKRANKMQKERDKVRGTIAKKRREFEVEKMQLEGILKELDLYRSHWNDPAIDALLNSVSELAGRWMEGEEEEEKILEEIRKSCSRGPRTRLKTRDSFKTHAGGDSELIIESLYRHIVDQRTEYGLLEKRLAKVKAERMANPDHAILDLSSRLDEALEELQAAQRDRSAADLARDDALAQVRSLERRTWESRKGSRGASKVSTFSAFSAGTRGLSNIKEENENAEPVGDNGQAEMSGGSLADELKAYQDIEDDLGSEVTIGVPLDGRGRDNLPQKYNSQALEDAQLLEEVAKLRRRIQHLEEQADEVGHGPEFYKGKLAEVTRDLEVTIERLKDDGVLPEPFGFGENPTADMMAFNDLVDEQDRCILAIEGRHPARERLRNIHLERMVTVEDRLRAWEAKYCEAIKRANDAESRANRMFGAKGLVLQDVAREVRARIEDLQEIVSGQIDFHRDIQPLFTSADNLATELHAIETDVLQQLEMPQDEWTKVEALLEKASQGAGGDADTKEVQEAREALGQILQRFQGASGMKLRGKWYQLRRVSGKLVGFVEDARERLHQDVLRLGMEIPERRITRAEAFATALDTRFSSVLSPLRQPRLFTTLVTTTLSFLTPHMVPYRRFGTFLLTGLRDLSGSSPVNFPRLRTRDICRVFCHVFILVMLQTYIALSRQLDLWVHGNSAVTTAYLHDLQDNMSCGKSSWSVDPKFMVFGSEVWKYYQGLLPSASAPVGDW